MRKTKTAALAAAASSTVILVAVGEMQGGGETVPAGGELTPELQETMGLDAEAIADLIERGHLIESRARVAAGDDGAELAAAVARAEAAEARVAKLEAELAVATAPAAKDAAKA